MKCHGTWPCALLCIFRATYQVYWLSPGDRRLPNVWCRSMIYRMMSVCLCRRNTLFARPDIPHHEYRIFTIPRRYRHDSSYSYWASSSSHRKCELQSTSANTLLFTANVVVTKNGHCIDRRAPQDTPVRSLSPAWQYMP